MSDLSTSLQVCRADASRQSRALWLVFSRHAAGDPSAQAVATLAAVGEGRLSLEGLFTAQRGGRLVGAAWAYSQTGGVGVVWPCRLVSGEGEQTRRFLWRKVEQFLADQQVRLAQCVLHTSDKQDAQAMCDVGYQCAAELEYFVALPDVFPSAQPDAQPLQFEPYRDSQHGRLAKIVEKTYVGTLDCPLLDELRTTDEVLEGYRSTGQSSARLWRFVTHQGRDIGVLLNAMHPAEKQLELVYMGLAPAARGQHWGRALVQETLWQARTHNAERVIVAADAKNAPALKAYRLAGMHRWARRRIFLKSVSV